MPRSKPYHCLPTDPYGDHVDTPQSVMAQHTPQSHTPLPLEIHEGANFVSIGGPGYRERATAENYAGIPSCVASIYHGEIADDCDEAHLRAMEYAEQILTAVNAHADLVAALHQAQTAILDLVKALPSGEASVDYCVVLDTAEAADLAITATLRKAGGEQ